MAHEQYRSRQSHFLVDPVQVPFMGFFRNDQETLQIMAKAATIVPKACDILGISLSDSESEVEDDTAGSDGDRSLGSQQLNGSSGGAVSNNAAKSHDEEVQEARPKPKFVQRASESSSYVQNVHGALGSHVQKSRRKRCASTPSTLGQSTSSARSTSLRLNPPNNKKRRFPLISISTPETGAAESEETEDNPCGNFSTGESTIRKKMFADIELLKGQLTQLASVERAKYVLMEKLYHLKHQLEEPHLTTSDPATATATTMNTDGTNEQGVFNYTATTITNNFSTYGASNNDGDEREEARVDMDDAVIFTDADLHIGAEETVAFADAEQEQEVGFLGH